MGRWQGPVPIRPSPYPTPPPSESRLQPEVPRGLQAAYTVRRLNPLPSFPPNGTLTRMLP